MPLLQELSDQLAAAESISWWWDSVELSSQRWVQEPGAFIEPKPTAENVAVAVADFDSFSGWWSPLLDTFIPRTTRGPLETAAAVELACHEDAYFYQEGDLSVREFHPVAAPLVYEVKSTADWVNLVDRFPKTVNAFKEQSWNDMFSTSGKWVEPDWEAISHDFDGVHVSVAGCLAAAYDPRKSGSYRTVLAGWNPDQTVWLREGFTLGRSVASVRQDQEGPGSGRVSFVTI